MDLNFGELRELVAALDQTDIAELILKGSDFELTLRKQTALSPAVVLSEGGRVGNGATPPSQLPEIPSVPTVSPPAERSPAADPSLVEITSPMVGTFYRSPAPEELPFVDVGDRIQSGQTVCIIEAMKLMNELESEVAGEIVEVLVENSEPVEFGQILMRVRTS
ncbi:MAG: acetyl-CoA carboxylase biotin carboxyl carrier protein [Leptolyngbyaceae cyanobacterium SL_1_1]|nr:acetyl-CoA carboxylase biotin carboxyl carrier protein [Leptolyngbyaceae cyanobacterium RM1_1_2]NJO09480.1 acetyl-CoA carboxylase biotin carboxyl carrier protein [Leptolyngbyaceae cyanobacterium SL_1_1]